ncbi:MAG: tRNA (adenosine(37)-N6)-threonylcarbamoyltransferase complex transferase subunit TsaD [Zetaproteobacteria bacterium]|nr:tRNA (adenosine(37)-N6)-threonylcarbamoyltransferase complex transferase subunit TsaD [Pseudobdellovibrionaceae bacterium]
MLAIGIESSCDDTAVAVLNGKRVVLSSLVSSQIKIHEKYGGTVPEIAAREHLSNLLPLFKNALEGSGVLLKDVDVVCVTRGPGLIGALLVGVSFAKGLAASLNVPLVPVDHVHAHVHGALLGLPQKISTEDLFPALTLVVSGGHTNLFYMANETSFELISKSIDDACGESFDKVAKLLGLDYPGGPEIEKRALLGDENAFPMPKMMAKKQSLDFSYSGLKTHIVYTYRNMKKDKKNIDDLCASFQKAAFEQIIRKVKIVLQSKRAQSVRSFIVSGGVAANTYFRQLVAQEIDVPAHFPRLEFCSDNAAMVAAYGLALYEQQKNKEDFQKSYWEPYSRYS